jgi:hypothetical protein
MSTANFQAAGPDRTQGGQQLPNGAIDDFYNPIYFQFPPLIRSDNKGANWREYDARMPEPIAIFMGGKARAIQLRWSYIVNGQVSNGKTWDIRTVSTYVKLVRGYFYNRVGSACIIKLRAYDVIGNALARNPTDYTFRATDVSVDHSETLVSQIDVDKEEIHQVYPLRTDLTLSLSMYVDPIREGAKNSAQGGDATGAGDDAKVYDLKKLEPIPTRIEWF